MGLFNLFGKNKKNAPSQTETPETPVRVIGEFWVWLPTQEGTGALFLLPVKPDFEGLGNAEFPKEVKTDSIVVVNYSTEGKYLTGAIIQQLNTSVELNIYVLNPESPWCEPDFTPPSSPLPIEKETILRDTTIHHFRKSRNFIQVQSYNKKANEYDNWLIGHHIESTWEEIRPFFTPGMVLRIFGMPNPASSFVGELWQIIVSKRGDKFKIYLSDSLAETTPRENYSLQQYHGPGYVDYPEAPETEEPPIGTFFYHSELKNKLVSTSDTGFNSSDQGYVMFPVRNGAYMFVFLPRWEQNFNPDQLRQAIDQMQHFPLDSILFLNYAESGFLELQTILNTLPNGASPKLYFTHGEDFGKDVQGPYSFSKMPEELIFDFLLLRRMAGEKDFIQFYLAISDHIGADLEGYIGNNISVQKEKLTELNKTKNHFYMIGGLDNQRLEEFFGAPEIFPLIADQKINPILLLSIVNGTHPKVAEAMSHLGVRSYLTGKSEYE